MLRTNQKRNGNFEVTIPWRAREPDLLDLEALLARASPNDVVRVCRDRDSQGTLRPVKIVLRINPATLSRE